MKTTKNTSKYLNEIGSLPEKNIDLINASLILGSIGRSNINVAVYHRHLFMLQNAVKQYLHGLGRSPDINQRQEALTQIIQRRYGYVGNENSFGNPDDANLTHTIDRRTGASITLGLLYLAVAWGLGWKAIGIDFPERFLIRLEHRSVRLIIDPYCGGKALSSSDLRALLKDFAGNHIELEPIHYREMNSRKILLRLQKNVRDRLLKDNRIEDAINVIKTMQLFAPNEPELWRESGFLYARLNNLHNAIAALEEYLKKVTRDDMRLSASAFLMELRARL